MIGNLVRSEHRAVFGLAMFFQFETATAFRLEIHLSSLPMHIEIVDRIKLFKRNFLFAHNKISVIYQNIQAYHCIVNCKKGSLEPSLYYNCR